MFAAAAFRDTFFAYTLRLVFGSRIFPHPDEKELPVVWQSKLSTPTSPRDSVPPTLNDGHSPDARSIVSETTAIANTPTKADPEKGLDSLLVDWYGPTDPDVSISWYFLQIQPLI
jgi:DHA1 family multidrug resistance protein-like MFS transporter